MRAFLAAAIIASLTGFSARAADLPPGYTCMDVRATYVLMRLKGVRRDTMRDLMAAQGATPENIKAAEECIDGHGTRRHSVR